jgi:DMSO/TMAO reductase YedYZ molybdopterin-dependent catalytic subunit
VTPRGTDWSLAALVAALVVTGALTAFAGSEGGVWVFALHDAAGFALAAVLLFKGRRVWRRVLRAARLAPRERLGVVAAALVAATLASGWAWASGARLDAAGYGLLNLHDALGAVLALGVLAHAVARARRPRRRDLAGRRQLLAEAGVAVAAVVAWRAQRPLARALGWRGARRRFTGSYETASFAGNAFPTTSWVADRPRPLDRSTYRLAVAGAVRRPLELTASELAAADALTATLDCTGGFYSTQHWRGTSLARLLERAGPQAGHVRVISHTGYRWSFALADARGFLLATHVGDEPLSHGHGAPVRLVAPGRRGFQWVKWVTRVEVHADADLGAPAATLWSSLTPAGRGE